MSTRILVRRSLNTAGVLACAACASTSIASVASPSAPRYGPGQVLVVAAYGDLSWRRDVEAEFARRHPAFVASVGAIDVSALTSATAIIEHIAADTVLEAVLLLVPAGAGTSQQFVANQYYAGTISKPWANTAATLYDKANDRVVWRADASTGGNAYASWADIRSSFVGKIVTQLGADGLVSTTQRLVRQRTRAPDLAAVAEETWQSRLPNSSEIVSLSASDLNVSTASSVFQRVASAVVLLEGTRGTGTAFIISRNGLALTNHHVVAGQSRLIARFANGSESPVRVLRSDETADVALVELRCLEDCYTVTVGAPDDLDPGTEIYALVY